jgi:hypothetical protein
MTIGVVYYRGQFPMTDRMPPKAANVEPSTETDGPAEEPGTPPAEAPTPAPEQGETETPAAQRRARLRNEIRAGMHRALKH